MHSPVNVGNIPNQTHNETSTKTNQLAASQPMATQPQTTQLAPIGGTMSYTPRHQRLAQLIANTPGMGLQRPPVAGNHSAFNSL